MKFLNFILTIYLLSLPCFTCADSQTQIVVSSSARIVQQFNFSKDTTSHNSKNDLCSPLCCCACCGIHVVSAVENEPIDFPIVFHEILPQISLYQSLLTSSFFGSIWQPPQIIS
ncbi:DUF6660 family protein [Flavobacterium sp. ASV13]|uniref:DUF6660 family protein n=1 Tax=Flavobacterium sp. ASV13 TaxID=1506583 RepID=UPI003526ECCA